MRSGLRRRVGVAFVALLVLPATPSPPSTSATVEGNFDVQSDVKLVASDGIPLSLDAYLPEAGRGHPAVILVHGGQWAGGDKLDVAAIAASLASRGWATFAVDYRLGVEKVARQAEDILDTVLWVRDHATRLRIDPDAITLIGASAGGHLAALAATQAGSGDGGDNRVAAVATWSGIFDFSALAPRDDGQPLPGCARACEALFGAGFLTGLLGCEYSDCPARYREGSPVEHVDDSDPPMLLATSTGDGVPPGQAREMAKALDRAGVEGEALIVNGSEHGYEVGARTFDRTLEFLDGRVLPDDSDADHTVLIAALVAFTVALAGIATIWSRRRRRPVTPAGTAAP